MLASVWIPSLAAIIFVTANLFYGIRKHKSMYTAYLVVYLILNTSFDWVISVPRYMTCAIPAFLFLSDFSERHKWTEPIITASMAIGLGLFDRILVLETNFITEDNMSTVNPKNKKYGLYKYSCTLSLCYSRFLRRLDIYGTMALEITAI